MILKLWGASPFHGLLGFIVAVFINIKLASGHLVCEKAIGLLTGKWAHYSSHPSIHPFIHPSFHHSVHPSIHQLTSCLHKPGFFKDTALEIVAAPHCRRLLCTIVLSNLPGFASPDTQITHSSQATTLKPDFRKLPNISWGRVNLSQLHGQLLS